MNDNGLFYVLTGTLTAFSSENIVVLVKKLWWFSE
jgi:hypothetical protein